MPLSIGHILNNRYRIVHLLGQGGFGAVYKAWDMNLNAHCAVKENLDTSDEARRQFENEARMLYGLRHSNLTKVSDYFVIPGQGQYLVMDYIEGENLESMVQKRGALPHAQVLTWINQVCEALIYLHGRTPPVIHRDIKPANIKITPQGEAVLVDFGIAKVFDPGVKTTVGAQAVTPGYSPPEQYGGGSTDAGSDVYSLGATAYTLLTGVVPPVSVQILSEAVPPAIRANQVNPSISKGVAEAVSGAMQPSRARRTPTVAAFRKALLTSSETVIPPEPVGPGAVGTGATRSPAKIHPVGGGRPTWLYLLGGGVLVVALIVIAYLIFGTGGSGSDRQGTETARSVAVGATLSARETQTPTESLERSLTPEPPISPELTFTPTPPEPTIVEGSPKPSVTSALPEPTTISSPASTYTFDFGAPMMLIPEGTYMMGSDKGNNDQSPVHEVFLDAFYIDIFEVTNGRYMECVNAGICEPPSSNGSYTQGDYYDNPEFIDYPVIYISWSDAQTYCEWRGARLPTEAEWEVAARGGLHGKLYPWGDESPGCYFYLPNGAKFNDDWVCKKSDTESVGSYQSNGYGLYDMAGNVLEWVADWYESNYYSESPFENPPGPTSGVQRVTRGGSWNSDRYSLQISFRNRYDPSTSSNFIGFRCARSP